MEPELGMEFPLFSRFLVICSQIFAVLPVNTVTLRVTYCSIIWTEVVIACICVHLYFLPVTILDTERDLGKCKDQWSYSHAVKLLYPLSVYIASIAYRINGIFKLPKHLRKFMKYSKSADQKLQLSKEDVKAYNLFTVAVIATFGLLTIPIHIVRLYMFYNASSEWETLLMFANLYVQNVSSWLVESQFVTIVFGVYLRMKKINKMLEELEKNANKQFYAKYSHLLEDFNIDDCVFCNKGKGTSLRREYLRSKFDSVYHTQIAVRENSTVLESVSFMRSLFDDLYKMVKHAQKAYQVAILSSLSCQWLMMLFDIYMEFYGFIGGDAARPTCATYIWILQYITRFILLVETPEKVTVEGTRTRYLVSALNSRFLDKNTKEELMLFINHIANTKIEFTACGFFTLNTHLITSAIAAGTTYLVILVQFHSV